MLWLKEKTSKKYKYSVGHNTTWENAEGVRWKTVVFKDNLGVYQRIPELRVGGSYLVRGWRGSFLEIKDII